MKKRKKKEKIGGNGKEGEKKEEEKKEEEKKEEEKEITFANPSSCKCWTTLGSIGL